MEKNLKIGDVVRIIRTEYKIVGDFYDTRTGYVKDDSGKYVIGDITEHFYVGRVEKTSPNQQVKSYRYSNIIVWSEDGQNWVLRS